MPGMSIISFCSFTSPFLVYAEKKGDDMPSTDALSAIFTRRSMRGFSSRPIDGSTIHTLLRAAFSAPAAENAHTRRFIVITDRNALDTLPALHPSAEPARQSPLSILVCCDTSIEPQTLFWPQDCAVATQNIMLAARAMGLGSLWCGIHPLEAREKAFISAFSLPGTVRPVSLVILGYPLQSFFEKDLYDDHAVFSNLWGKSYRPKQEEDSSQNVPL